MDSLSLAVAAVLDPRSPEDVLAAIVAVGQDTDTIAGGLLGARDRATALPPRWLAVRQFADELHTAADQLAAAHG